MAAETIFQGPSDSEEQTLCTLCTGMRSPGAVALGIAKEGLNEVCGDLNSHSTSVSPIFCKQKTLNA